MAWAVRAAASGFAASGRLFCNAQEKGAHSQKGVCRHFSRRTQRTEAGPSSDHSSRDGGAAGGGNSRAAETKGETEGAGGAGGVGTETGGEREGGEYGIDRSPVDLLPVPEDIFTEIGTHADLNTRITLSLVCSATQNATCAGLYRTLSVVSTGHLLVRTLARSEDLPRMVHSLEFGGTVLAAMVNLKHLRIEQHINLHAITIDRIRFRLRTYAPALRAEMPLPAIKAAVENLLPIVKYTGFDEKARTFVSVDGKFWNDIFSEMESLEIDVNTAWPWPHYVCRTGFFFVPTNVACRSPPQKMVVLIAAQGAYWSNRFAKARNGILSLPQDIITHILDSYTVLFRVKEEKKDWVEKTQFLLNICLLCKEWGSVARMYLYRREIRLDSIQSIKLLMRTIEHDLGSPCPVQNLTFENIPGEGDAESRSKLAHLAAALVVHSPGLRQVRGTYDSLSFAGIPVVPTFEYLRRIHFQDEQICPIAPLLANIPHLEVMELCSVLSEDEEDDLHDIAVPTLNLKKLRLKCIGPLVAHLFIKGMVDIPQQGDEDLSRCISHFTSLSSLRVDGSDWEWEDIYDGLVSSLECFAISYSKKACGHLAQHLARHDWQPKLGQVSGYHWTDCDYYYGVRQSDVSSAKTTLEQLCNERNITFIWISEGEPQQGGGCTDGKNRRYHAVKAKLIPYLHTAASFKGSMRRPLETPVRGDPSKRRTAHGNMGAGETSAQHLHAADTSRRRGSVSPPHRVCRQGRRHRAHPPATAGAVSRGSRGSCKSRPWVREGPAQRPEKEGIPRPHPRTQETPRIAPADRTHTHHHQGQKAVLRAGAVRAQPLSRGDGASRQTSAGDDAPSPLGTSEEKGQGGREGKEGKEEERTRALPDRPASPAHKEGDEEGRLL
ncbi:hypothetical protein C8J57DRAFT_1246073 [Mycena rebaudengoi]|nr:hypothetical protein C8J57DRAFT_1246073 [Mycena rebaudengoi]